MSRRTTLTFTLDQQDITIPNATTAKDSNSTQGSLQATTADQFSFVAGTPTPGT